MIFTIFVHISYMKWLIKHSLLIPAHYSDMLKQNSPSLLQECSDLLRGIQALRCQASTEPLAYLEATKTQRTYLCILCKEEDFPAFSQQFSTIMQKYEQRVSEARQALDKLKNS